MRLRTGRFDRDTVVASEAEGARLAPGTSGRNEGDITIYATDGVTVLGHIAALFCETEQAIQTVPAGRRDVLINFNFGQGFNFINLMARASAAVAFTNRYFVQADGDAAQPSPGTLQPIVFDAGTDYCLLCGNVGNVLMASVNGYRLTV